MKRENIFWGCVLLAAAAFVILSRMGFLADVGLFSIVATVILGSIIIKSVFSLEFGGILIPLAIICILFDEELGITDLTPVPVLAAAILGTIGLSMIFPHAHRHHYKNDSSRKNQHNDKYVNVINQEDGSFIQHNVTFGSSMKYVNCNDFKNAELGCSFGALQIYFDNAIIQDDQAYINLDVSFAGVEIYIPRNWQVNDQLSNKPFASMEIKHPGMSTGEKTVIITGSIRFCGVEIIYV